MISGAEQEDEPGEPEQVHERLDEDPEVDGAVGVDLLGDHEQVLARDEVVPDADLVRDLPLGGVGVLARRDRAERLPVPLDVDEGSDLGRVRALALPELR